MLCAALTTLQRPCTLVPQLPSQFYAGAILYSRAPLCTYTPYMCAAKYLECALQLVPALQLLGLCAVLLLLPPRLQGLKIVLHAVLALLQRDLGGLLTVCSWPHKLQLDKVGKKMPDTY